MTDEVQHGSAVTQAELAEIMGVSTRRLRQMAEAGDLARPGRGRFDVGQAVHVSVGRKWLAANARGVSPGFVDAWTATAIGWLSGHETVRGRDVAAWNALAARCGKSPEAAHAALLSAAALMGEASPTFAASTAQ